jgi:hypothetical protein
MNKLIIAGLFSLTGLAGLAAVAPASAASIGNGSVPSCSSLSDTNIDANADAIALQLKSDGYKVNAVEEWNGCVRAYLENPDGSGEHMAYFDPDSLKPIAGTYLNDAQG